MPKLNEEQMKAVLKVVEMRIDELTVYFLGACNENEHWEDHNADFDSERTTLIEVQNVLVQRHGS